jgi:hypothetical protein
MKYIGLFFVVFIQLAGCSIPRSKADGGPLPNHEVNPGAKVLILNMADGQEQGEAPASGSGQGMVAALGKVMASHEVPLSTTATSALRDGLDEARRAGFQYVLRGTITLWEDNATAWSGNGDKLSIYLQLYDAKSRELIAASTHKRVATGVTFVSGSPNRFMDEVATGALGKIYGWSQMSGNTSARSSNEKPRAPVANLNPPLTDAEAMNAELRQLAKDSLARGDQKAAKDYLDMIVPTVSPP